ncbi:PLASMODESMATA CALLOSE-BINDING PROTEIN 3 isoform X2 [Setaria italica]|uniref:PLASMODESMATA CALLOSE-BINDING PROTEIN 3 isoform X2 n=1 Tax=Setaria italica TaxID=4555 RepID=UPI000BE4CD8D|nr:PLASMODESMATA CALLOSE-BINDING PROTEIN 3 isoform X2 [Setaria italica]
MADAARLFLLLVAVAAALAGRSDGAWCVCRPELGDSALQKTLDYACGDGADCKPILQNGPCFAPDTVRAHCSYAVNSFYQRNNQNAQACVFSGTATLAAMGALILQPRALLGLATAVRPACTAHRRWAWARRPSTTTAAPMSSRWPESLPGW